MFTHRARTSQAAVSHHLRILYETLFTDQDRDAHTVTAIESDTVATWKLHVLFSCCKRLKMWFVTSVMCGGAVMDSAEGAVRGAAACSRRRDVATQWALRSSRAMKCCCRCCCCCSRSCHVGEWVGVNCYGVNVELVQGSVCLLVHLNLLDVVQRIKPVNHPVCGRVNEHSEQICES